MSYNYLNLKGSNSIHTIVCGLGSVGFRVLGYLEKVSSTSISIVTFKTHPDWDEYLSGSRSQVFFGDARREDLLEKAGIQQAQVIVIVTDSDSHNISIAFDAFRLNPEVRIVMRLQHDDLAQHLKDQLPHLETWNPTALATPMFVRASLGKSILGEALIDQSIYLLQEISLTDLSKDEVSKVLESHFLVCGYTADGAVVTADQVLDGGGQGLSKVLVIKGPDNSSIRTSLIPQAFSEGILNGHKKVITAIKNVYQSFTDIPEQIKVLFGFIVIIFLSSIYIFRKSLSLDVFDSIYFVSTLMTTTGFGDISLQNATPWIKIYGSVLMFFSVVMVAGLISFINDRMISVRFRNLVGPQFKDQKPHIIVTGLGKLGYSITRELTALGENVIAVSDGGKDDYSEDLRKLVPIVQGRELDGESLKRARIGKAKGVVVASQNEIRNLTDGLSAKKANSNARVVVRTLDIQLAKKMNASLPIDQVLSDSEVSATNFVASILVKGALVGLDWQNHFVVLSLTPHAGGKEFICNPQGTPLYISLTQIKEN